MQAAVFSAKCPYEIGDRINVVRAAGSNKNGQLFSVGVATITDIACTHYLKSGEVLFTYEIEGSGTYIPLVTVQEAGMTL